MFRVGIVGFGRLAQEYYTSALRTLGDVTVAAVADPLEASRAVASASFPHAKIHSVYKDLLHQPIDALLVASPPSTHLAILNSALPMRIPIFIEKPFLLFDELKRLTPSVEARRLIMPNFNRRFWPAYRRLREICASGQLGRLRRAEFVLRVDVRPWLSVTSHRVEEAEGGALYDLGSSQLDLIRFVLGHKIQGLRATAKTVRWPSDEISIDAQLSNGTEVNCEVAHSDSNRERIIIFGDRALARIENPNRAVHFESRRSWTNAIVGYTKDALALAPKALLRRRSALHYTIRSSLAEFFGALKAHREFSPGFAEAEANTICLEAALSSIREKRLVEMSGIADSIHA